MYILSLISCILTSCCLFADGQPGHLVPPGHLQPLGSHMPPMPVEVREDPIDPLEFFEKYVKASKPVLMRGIVKSFPSFDSLKSDEYLKQHYGTWEIQAEPVKKETRKARPIEMSYAQFLDTYNESNIYLITDIVPSHPFSNDVFIPKCMLCGGYTDAIVNSIMWFSSGGTKSVLHNDDLENINCLYDGVKELALFDKKHDDLIPIDHPEGSYSSVDVDSVDMYKYPTLSKVPWYKATMEAGDCFYIPYKWHHQVNSARTRNMAINFWWAQLADLSSKDTCPESMDDLPSYIPLSNVNLSSEPDQLRSKLIDLLDSDTSTIKLSYFINLFQEDFSETFDTKAIESFFHKFDDNNDGMLALHELLAVSHENLQLFHDHLSTLESEVASQSEPAGHLQPLGSHVDPLSLEVRETWPDPIGFFNDYAKPGKPFVIRGAAKHFPGYSNWQDDEYLKSKYGSWQIDVEEGKKENRSGGAQSMTFHEFLDRYKKSDIYLVSDILPTNPMAEQVFLPKSLLCGGYTDVLNTVVMWFSSGGTRSVLHNDGFDNLNCVYEGSKEFVFIDKKHEDLVPIDRKEGSYSSVDVDSVDMHKYPTLAEVPWYNVTMTAGDCIFIPYMWFHQVNSMGLRNLAVNVWWTHLEELPSHSSCQQELSNLPEYAALSNYKFSDESEQYRRYLFEMFKGSDTLSYKVMKNSIPMVDFSTPVREEMAQFVRQFFDEIDADNDGAISVGEVNAARAETLQSFFGFFEESEESGIDDASNVKEEL